MRGRLVEDRIEERICKIRLIDGVVANYYPQEELIRCKDCQYWMKSPYRESSVFGLCFKHKDIAIASDETNWCSWAERRTDEQTD